ncbi:MAG: TIGR02099 family protein [Burkholderiales bacterium]|nr:TIGR02099 family protein [Burkholderiales bacterium]
MAQSEQTEDEAAASEKEDFSPLAELGIAPQKRSLVRRLLRFFGFAALFAYFAFAAVVLGLRFWILPQIEEHPELISQAISRNIGQRVSIGSVDSGWQRLRPYLALTDLRLYDNEGRVALSLPSASCTLSWESLAFGVLRFHSLAFDKPQLNIRRDQRGAVYVAGVRLNTETAGEGFSGWLLAQREVIIRDAQVSWDDQLRSAPPLSLADVNFVMRNRGSHHRFALRAQPPRELAAALDLRGDLEGATFAQLQAWTGSLYAELPYTDLSAWRTWVDHPLEIQQGQGGLRLWLRFAEKQLTAATADVALGNVNARLAPDLPVLELRSLQGRLSATRAQGGYAIGGKKVAMTLLSGVTLPPAQFALQWSPGDGVRAESGEVRIDALELQPLAILGEYLPLPTDLRKFLAAAEPQGSVSDMHVDWQGPLAKPQRFSARGRFDRLGMRAHASLPGFSGISGNIDGNEKGGTVLLNASKVVLALPSGNADPSRELDTLTAQLAWSQVAGELQLKLSNIAFANADLAGTAFGSYATAADGPGVVDITARLARAEAHGVPRYIPFLNKVVRDWLDQALVAGHASEVSMRLKGNLKDFPFRSKKDGVFQISAKVAGGSLRYAAGWPGIDAIDGNLLFDGRSMEVTSHKASVLGARVSNARVVLPDLFAPDRILSVNGQAEGPTAEFLKFVAQSPVNTLIGGITAGMGATGSGKLQLKLDLPLARMADVKVAGSYQMAGNQISIDTDWPPVSQVGGRLDFTEKGVSMRTVKAQFLGGPVAVNLASQRDGSIAVDARGTFDASALRAALDQPLLSELSGTAAWSSKMIFGRSGANIVVESGLQGITSTLPAPLNKAGADVLPLRFEHTAAAEAQSGRWSGPTTADRSTLALGTIVRMEQHRRREAGKMVIARSAVGLNEAPHLPEAGIVLNGKVAELDLDRWLRVLGGSGGSGGVAVPLTSLNLKIGALDVYGKRINDVALRAGFQGSDWLADVDARELAGKVRWRAQGKGRVSAQLSHFTFPQPTPGKLADDAPAKELPGLDIVADNLVVHDKKLGRLELTAANEGLDWRIEKLTLATPDSSLNADGLWQGVAAHQRTRMNLKLEIKDVGKFLERIGYPGSMQRGTAKLLGKLSWAGNPQTIDYPSLTGDLSLIAAKGQFLKIEPGIGKLLGILSLQALPRRITLDFRDIFSEGFAFDNITATASVAKGVLHTQDFIMHGPSAQVGMSGDIDLARETQSLKVRVVPSVGDSLSVAGLVLLANPITGVASFLAQRLLKDPLGQAFAYRYVVTGSWVDPKVEKMAHETPAGSTHAPPGSIIEAPAGESQVK